MLSTGIKQDSQEGGTLKDSVNSAHFLMYSLPYISIIFLYAPLHVLQAIYVKYYGISLAAMASILIVGRIFDAVADPVFGYLSDYFKLKTGSRKPVVILGVCLFSLSAYFLFLPPEKVTAFYLGFWLIAFFLGWTMFEISHLAWGSELSTDTHQKTKVFSYRATAGYLGLFCFYSMPFLIGDDSNEITPEVIRWSGVIAIALIIPSIYSSMRFVPDGRAVVSQNESSEKGILFLVKSMVDNTVFLIFITIYIFAGLGAGMWFGLLFIYMDSYLLRGDLFAASFMVATLVGIASTAVWYRLTAWFGKKAVWGIAIILLMISTIYTGILGPDNLSVFEVILVKTINTLGFIAVLVVAPSVLSDIVDYSHWKYGLDQAGVYFSIQTFSYKTGSAVGAAMGLAIASWYGYDVSATSHSVESLFGIHLAISWLPTLLFSIAFICLLFLPINGRRHAIVMRRLGKPLEN